MSLNEQHHLGEYAPAPKRRVTRARKALIAVMAIGAFAATSGAGTFASFTASTDNTSSNDVAGDNPFQTGDYELLNSVLAGTGANATWVTVGPNCSSVTNGSNNHAECDYLWEGNTNDVINGVTTYVKIENNSATDGTGDGKLVFYAPTACVQGALGTGSNCADIRIYVQEIAEAGAPGTGTTTPTLTNAANLVDECVFGRVDTDATAGYTGADSDANADVNNGGTQLECTYGKPLNTLPSFGSEVTIDSSFPALKTNGNEDVRYFKIFAILPHNPATCGAVTEPLYTGANASNGFDATTGIGCHNGYQDRSAKFELRWMLVAS